MKKMILGIVAAGLLGGSISVSAVAQQTFGVIDLGDLPGGIDQVEPRAINAAGQVAGYSWFSLRPGLRQAFLWDSTNGMQNLGNLPGGTDDSRAFDLNDAGQVVGDSSSSAGVRAFLWDGTNGMQSLGVLPGGSRSIAYSINNAGQVVGSSPNSTTGLGRAFLWDSAIGMQSLGNLPGNDTSAAYGINDAGQVVGSTGNTTTGVSRAFLWDSANGMQDLGVLLGDDRSLAYDINDAGHVVGYSYDSATGLGRAFLWDDTNGMQDLGVLPGGDDSLPANINAAGQVVGWSTSSAGYRAFLWDSTTGLRDLNDLIDPGDPLAPYITLVLAADVNDLGMIVAAGRDSRNGAYHAYLLTPIDGRIVDTGPGPSIGHAWLIGRRSDGVEQSLAAKFQVSDEVDVGSVELWMSVGAPGSFKFSIHSDGGEVPGAELYSSHFNVDDLSPSRWLGLNSLAWRLQPGTYWATFEGGQLGVMGGGGTPNPSDAPLSDEAWEANNTTPTWTWINRDDLDIGVRIYEAGVRRCTGNWGASSRIHTVYGDPGPLVLRDEDFGGAYYGDCRTSVAALARDEVPDGGGLVRSLASADIARGVLRLSGELMDRGELSQVLPEATIKDEVVAHVSGGGTGTLTFTLNVWGEFSGTWFGAGARIENFGSWYFQSGAEIVAEGHSWRPDSAWTTPSGWGFRDQISYSVTVTDGQVIPLEAALFWFSIAEVGENNSFDLGNSAWLQITASDGVTFTSASGELLSEPYVPESVARLDLLAESVRGVGPGNSLADKVALARMYFDIPDISAACSTLGAFIHEVQAQSGKKIETALAKRLIADAQRAQGAIGCQ